MKQDLRALRRRPLFTPLFVPAALAIVAFMLLGWGITARTTTSVIVVPAEQARPDIAVDLRDTGVEAVFAEAQTPGAQSLAKALRVAMVPLPAGGDVLKEVRKRHDGQTVVLVVSAAQLAEALGQLGARPDEAAGRHDILIVVIPRFGHLAVLPLHLPPPGAA